MSVQSRSERWTRFNHLFAGKLTEFGNAVCENCGADENDMRITKPCPNGPCARAENEGEAKKEVEP